jgi:hypothetical protein
MAGPDILVGLCQQLAPSRQHDCITRCLNLTQEDPLASLAWVARSPLGISYVVHWAGLY